MMKIEESKNRIKSVEKKEWGEICFLLKKKLPNSHPLTDYATQNTTMLQNAYLPEFCNAVLQLESVYKQAYINKLLIYC